MSLRRVFFAAFVTLFSVVWMAGCSSSDSDSDGQLDLFLKETIVEATVTETYISVKSSRSWTLSFEYEGEASDWIDLERSEPMLSGSGNKNGLLYFHQNSSQNLRRVNIILNFGSASESIEVELVQKGASGGGDQTVSSLGWVELPVTDDVEGRLFAYHKYTLGGENARNYSFYFDTKERISYWVAYPMAKAHIDGSGRPARDPWSYDPKVSKTYQANYVSGGIRGYDRGHQIASADRPLSVSAEGNAQTFYCTNATPQNSNFNQNKWAKLEGQVRSWAKENQTDTLYIVTGAVLQTVGGGETISYAKDRSNNDVAVPNYYYKVLLQRYSGADNLHGYRAIGFWFKNDSHPTDAVFKPYASSVREIEEKTGFDFFSNLTNPNNPYKLTPQQAEDIETAEMFSAWRGL